MACLYVGIAERHAAISFVLIFLQLLLWFSVEMKLEKATAALLLVASLICLFGAQGLSESIIVAGSSITAGDSGNATWLSSSGKFAFGFYPEGSGFAVGIQFIPNSSYSTVIWTADRDRQPIPANATLTFGNEGLVLHMDEGDRTISNLYDGSSQLGYASMFDSGNFVVYDVHSNFVWQTFDNPTDTLMGGQTLYFGNNIISSVSANNHSSGRFRFEVQNRQNGKAVLYPVNTPETAINAYWTFVRIDSPPVLDGLNESKPKPSFTFSSNGISLVSSQDMRPCFARIEADGYFRIYVNQSGSIMVSEQYPRGENKCLIKGVCGANSYCNSTGKGEVSCFCLPGYVFIDPSRVFSGCQRNFTIGSCEEVSVSTNNSTFNKISRSLNITGPDDSYNSSQVQSEDECRNACFEDCDCYAALFFGTSKQCSKQRQPFLYGRALFGQDEPTVAFFRVGDAEQKNQLSIKPVGIGSLRVLGTLPIVLSLLLTTIFAITLDFLIFFLFRYRIGMYRRLCESMETGLAKAMAPRFFSYTQLEEATDGYKEEIGEGNYGKVFKGLLPPLDPGTPIAVKKLKSVPGKVEQKFRNELKSIGRVHHRNLVRLLGFCHEGTDWILVYEYMSGGSLADLIFKSQESLPSWKQRVGIAMDVARGLLHLHDRCDVAIIHGDIKPENILIGGDGIAKIGDLGLAKHLQPGKHLTHTRPRGTLNYKAPEWANTSVSTKVDVVSFGVLLLELLCLMKFQPPPHRLDGEYNLASWAYKCLKGQSELQVPGGDVDAKELEVMLKIALWCLVGTPEKRPSMRDVFLMLSRKKVVEFPPVPFLDWNVPANAGQPALVDAHKE